ncbi:hypothetical protein JX266_011697 [Neoarthrinium moseri]|nr:hypothetical protein JX266_011697 [Neoarthrinium moseri]
MANEVPRGPPSPVPVDRDKTELIETTYHSQIEVTQKREAKVVIKRFRHQKDPRTPTKFLNEVAALKASGGHENTAEILDSSLAELTITLRFEEGRSLDRHIDDRSRSTLSADDSNVVLTQMASALAHLHRRSVIHDDVKPDNIMWSSSQQRSVLIDFGAAIIDMPEGYFNPSGTPSYAPPEFLKKRKDAKGDIWGLGVTMLFAFGYVALPDGEWLLPAVFEEGTPRREMLEWLAEVEIMKHRTERGNPLLAAMLETDLGKRIGNSVSFTEFKMSQEQSASAIGIATRSETDWLHYCWAAADEDGAALEAAEEGGESEESGWAMIVHGCQPVCELPFAMTVDFRVCHLYFLR